MSRSYPFYSNYPKKIICACLCNSYPPLIVAISSDTSIPEEIPDSHNPILQGVIGVFDSLGTDSFPLMPGKWPDAIKRPSWTSGLGFKNEIIHSTSHTGSSATTVHTRVLGSNPIVWLCTDNLQGSLKS